MPRRRGAVPPKIILINRGQPKLPSAYILNLQEKISPPKLPSWIPTELDHWLSQSWGWRKKTALDEDWRWPQIRWPQINIKEIFTWEAWPKTALSFAAVCLVLILPLRALSAYGSLADSKSEIINIGEDAFSHLYAGSASVLSFNLSQAAAELKKAAELFSQSQEEVNKINPLWRSVTAILPLVGDKYQSGRHLLLGGQNLTLAAQLAASAIDNLANQNQGPLGTIAEIEKIARLVLPNIRQANEHLLSVNENNLPPAERAKFAQVKNKLRVLTNGLAELPRLTAPLRQLLGENGKKRYLIVFQNNGEIRPTGGFMGSFAVIDVKDGVIQKMEMPGGGPFDLAGNLKVFVKTPAPLQIMRTRWEMQDANWFPDFPASAKKIAWFYEKSGGATVDGVVAVDASFFREILKITGPVALPEYNKTIDYDNFISETQNQVEFGYDRQLNRPKQFLADLAPKVLAKLFEEKNNLLSLLTLMQEAARQKHWQIYSFDQSLENFLIAQGLGGELKNNQNGDFLAVINTNIAGQKTDWMMEESISHQARIAEDGSVIDTVTIIRTHHGKENEPLTGVQNVNYLRLYAPQGSVLLASSGFKYPPEGSFKVPEKWYADDADLLAIESEEKIDEQTGTRVTTEFDKTVFANWSMTKPGETSVLTLSYQLPFRVINENGYPWGQHLSYSLLVQKQAGSGTDKFSNKIIVPNGYQTIWREGAADSEIPLNEDLFLGIVATK